MARQTFGSTNPPAGFVGTSSSTATRNSRAGGDGEDPNEAQAPPGSYPTQHPYLLQAHPTGDTSFRHHGLQSSPTHRNRPTLHSPSLPNPQQLLVRHTLLSGQPEMHSDAVTGGRLSSQTYDLPMDSSSPRHDYSSGGTSVAANPSVSRSGAGREGNRIHSEIGGYGVVLEQDSRRENLVCPLCEKILREPMQTTCGHRFCRTCLDEAIRLNELCPLDDEKVVKAFPDRHCQREIDCLRVKCPHQPTCSWCGQLKELEDHLSTCPFHPLPCTNPGCAEYLPRDLVQRHTRERCDHRRVTCTYCRSPIPHTEVDLHIKRECPDYPVECPNKGCDQQVTRSTLHRHRETECEAATQPCPLGCGTVNVSQPALPGVSWAEHLHHVWHYHNLPETHPSPTNLVKRYTVHHKHPRPPVFDSTAPQDQDGQSRTMAILRRHQLDFCKCMPCSLLAWICWSQGLLTWPDLEQVVSAADRGCYKANLVFLSFTKNWDSNKVMYLKNLLCSSGPPWVREVFDTCIGVQCKLPSFHAKM